ncbi:MIF4G domain containing protein [Reticulomyxa filosa]|uniref:MIF4G domain containing protein n=1 Tax=Reticulomyxa filosa TaxID=46433 RepID=X6M1D0_RETFI|nr:MIF4G domain containing protein [Reticulomyxa filosa]|eukprot:ETO07232.1 MIF4G domain containing protein [Reticulomyxa filosa]
MFVFFSPPFFDLFPPKKKKKRFDGGKAYYRQRGRSDEETNQQRTDDTNALVSGSAPLADDNESTLDAGAHEAGQRNGLATINIQMDPNQSHNLVTTLRHNLYVTSTSSSTAKANITSLNDYGGIRNSAGALQNDEHIAFSHIKTGRKSNKRKNKEKEKDKEREKEKGKRRTGGGKAFQSKYPNLKDNDVKEILAQINLQPDRLRDTQSGEPNAKSFALSNKQTNKQHVKLVTCTHHLYFNIKKKKKKNCIIKNKKDDRQVWSCVRPIVCHKSNTPFYAQCSTAKLGYCTWCKKLCRGNQKQGSICISCGERLTAKYHRWYPELVRLEPLQKTRNKDMYRKYKPLLEKFNITWHDEKGLDFVVNNYMLMKIWVSDEKFSIQAMHMERIYMVGVFAGREFTTGALARKLLREGLHLEMFRADFPNFFEYLRDQRAAVAEQLNAMFFEGKNPCYFHAHHTNIEGWFDSSYVSSEMLADKFKNLCNQVVQQMASTSTHVPNKGLSHQPFELNKQQSSDTQGSEGGNERLELGGVRLKSTNMDNANNANSSNNANNSNNNNINNINNININNINSNSNNNNNNNSGNNSNGNNSSNINGSNNNDVNNSNNNSSNVSKLFGMNPGIGLNFVAGNNLLSGSMNTSSINTSSMNTSSLMMQSNSLPPSSSVTLPIPSLMASTVGNTSTSSVNSLSSIGNMAGANPSPSHHQYPYQQPMSALITTPLTLMGLSHPNAGDTIGNSTANVSMGMGMNLPFMNTTPRLMGTGFGLSLHSPSMSGNVGNYSSPSRNSNSVTSMGMHPGITGIASTHRGLGIGVDMMESTTHINPTFDNKHKHANQNISGGGLHAMDDSNHRRIHVIDNVSTLKTTNMHPLNPYTTSSLFTNLPPSKSLGLMIDSSLISPTGVSSANNSTANIPSVTRVESGGSVFGPTLHNSSMGHLSTDTLPIVTGIPTLPRQLSSGTAAISRALGYQGPMPGQSSPRLLNATNLIRVEQNSTTDTAHLLTPPISPDISVGTNKQFKFPIQSNNSNSSNMP